MKSSTKVAAIQLNGKATWQENKPIIERLVRDAASTGAQVVVLPENLYAMPANPHDLVVLGFDEADEPVTWLRHLAHSAQVWLVAGTLPIRAQSAAQQAHKLWARSYVIDREGEIRAKYDKIHLFDVTVPTSDQPAESYRESDLFMHGAEPVVVDTPVGRLGLAICFDLRFPELFRRLTELGATWVCLPSAFTQATGCAHWEPLLRARAIENQVFMVAAAQVGMHVSGRHTYGHSMIVDPWGQILANANTLADCLITAEMDPVAQAHIRQQFPVLELRRF
ncbi:MAG: carbon-nitrogen hydrolase family protein [Halothiobacillus sp.]